MKKKFLISTFLTVIILATTVFAVSSEMRYGNVDGTWGLVDGFQVDPDDKYIDGATCLRYADGPDGTQTNPNTNNNDITVSIYNSDNTGIQEGSTTNWNQVRYGSISSIYNNGCGRNNVYSFQKQSGLAFNGVDATTPKRIAPETDPFPLGKLSHINNPISLINGNGFNKTYMDLVIKDVDCGEGIIVDDLEGNPYSDPPPDKIDLVYRLEIAYDETPNSPPCKYPGGSACADAIIPGQMEGNTLFCKYEYEDGTFNVIEYNVYILGFSSIGLNDSVENLKYSDQIIIGSGVFISNEGSINSVVPWAEIGPVLPLAVEMNFFEASGAEESIVLRWQTAFETDNIGFNVYRSETLIREDAIQLNQELIASLVPPGSTFGADYEFIDNSALPYTTYFYWIEDVDVNGTITTHGPVRAEWVD